MARKARKLIKKNLTDAHLCAIALGSNLGDRLSNLENALARLDEQREIQVIEVSQWHCTKAVTADPKAIQPDYLNGCAILATSLSPEQLLQVLLEIETELGRVRRDRWDARTLDLDLLLYEQKIINLVELVIPHPRMMDRAFVLIPLAEIAADWIHPITQSSILQLAQHLCTEISD
jgi:2-amino-4-hydroxy-6-hydroxymethyldihydropteridine diphosphokinase